MENNDTLTNDNRRMLVADDDPAILRLIATILEKENFNVVMARDGREAYKILQSDPNFTAAILDVVMPHISGPELVRYRAIETDSGDDDDCRAGSEAFFGQFCRGRDRVPAEAVYHRATTDHVADVDW